MEKKIKGKKTPTGSPAQGTLPFRPEKPETSGLSELLAVHLRPLVDQMADVSVKLDALQAQMSDLMEKTDLNSETTRKLNNKLENCEKTVDGLLKDKATVERQVIQLQMEKAAYYLRFQGIPEEKEEKLRDIVLKILMEAIPDQELEKEIDVVYRTHTAYVKRNKLPGEVLVKFSRRQTRDLILRVVRHKPLKTEHGAVETLKDIPLEVRKRRAYYKPLALFLQEKKTVYRWLFPEGLAFLFKGKKNRIDSLEKMKAFLDLQKPQKQKKKKDTEKREKAPAELEEGEEEDSSGETSPADFDYDEAAADLAEKARERHYQFRERNK